MSDTPKQRLMQLADDHLRLLSQYVSEMVLDPSLKITVEELAGFVLAYNHVVTLVQAAYPKRDVGSAIASHYWPGPDVWLADRMAVRLKKTQHAVNTLQALYGPEAG